MVSTASDAERSESSLAIIYHSLYCSEIDQNHLAYIIACTFLDGVFPSARPGKVATQKSLASPRHQPIEYTRVWVLIR